MPFWIHNCSIFREKEISTKTFLKQNAIRRMRWRQSMKKRQNKSTRICCCAWPINPRSVIWDLLIAATETAAVLERGKNHSKNLCKQKTSMGWDRIYERSQKCQWNRITCFWAAYKRSSSFDYSFFHQVTNDVESRRKCVKLRNRFFFIKNQH